MLIIIIPDIHQNSLTISFMLELTMDKFIIGEKNKSVSDKTWW